MGPPADFCDLCARSLRNPCGTWVSRASYTIIVREAEGAIPIRVNTCEAHTRSFVSRGIIQVFER